MSWCILGFTSASAQTYEVPSEYPDIQSAINAIPVEGSGEILVAPGTYTGPGNRYLSGFGFKSIQVRSSGGPASTIIDCQHLGYGFYFDSSTSTGTSVEGFTIRNAGFGNNGSSNAIQCYGAWITVENCIIEDCSSDAMIVSGGRPTVKRTTFRNNGGSGIYVYGGGNAVIDTCIFQTNRGQGLYLSGVDSNTVVTGSQFVNNVGWEGEGAGVYAQSSSPKFVSCDFRNNEAHGVYGWNSSATFNSCTFIGNGKWDPGGGIYAYNSSITVDSSTFLQNTGSGWQGQGGGAVCLDSYSLLTVSGSLFDGNVSDDAGGAISVSASSFLRATGCTFVNNAAPVGAAISVYYNLDLPGGTILDRCLIAFSSQGPGLTINWMSGVQITCTDIYGNSGGDWTGALAGYLGQGGNISANPLFCDAANGDYFVTANSPVADANNGACATIGAFDVGCGAAELSLYPSPMNFSASVDGPNPVPQNLQITNLGGGILNWTLSKQSNWLQINSTAGSAPAHVVASVDIVGLPGGVYYDELVVVSDDAVNSPQVVPVILTVTAGELSISPTLLDFQSQYGAPAPPAQTITVSNTGGGTLSCQLSNGQAWLQLSEYQFSVNPPRDVSVSIDPTGLLPGTYKDTIVIVSDDALNSPRYIGVTLTVTVGEISVSHSLLEFESQYGATAPPDAKTITVSNTGSGTLFCQLSNGQPWLQLSESQFSVNPPRDVSVSIDPTDLLPGTYEDIIAIMSDNALNSPQYVGVTLIITDAAPPTIEITEWTHPIDSAGGDTVLVRVNGDDSLSLTFLGSSPVIPNPSITAPNRPPTSTFVDNGNGTAVFTWDPVSSTTDTYITVTVDDEWRQSQLVVGIIINLGPSLTLACGDSVSLEEDETFHCRLVAVDPNNDDLTITWNGIPPEAGFTDNRDGTADFTFTPDYRHVDSTLSARFEVSDGYMQDAAALTIDVYNRPLQVQVTTGANDDLLITEPILIEFNEPVQPDSLDKYLGWNSSLAAGLHYQYYANNHLVTISAVSGDLTPLDTILVTLEVGLCDLAYHPLEQQYQRGFIVGPVVYPGDANHDGIVDERDVLPLGLYWGNRGPSRTANTDLTWAPSPARVNYNDSSWSPVNSVYCDADGSGIVDAYDICGVTDNWSLAHTVAENDKSSDGISLATSLDMVDESVLQMLYQAIIECPESQGRNTLRESLEAALGQPSTETLLPTTVELYQNYPNPFNPFTTIQFYLPTAGRARLTVYNLLGQHVVTLIDGQLNGGYVEASWDATDLSGNAVASGIYFYRLETDGFIETQRMLLLK